MDQVKIKFNSDHLNYLSFNRFRDRNIKASFLYRKKFLNLKKNKADSLFFKKKIRTSELCKKKVLF